MTDDAAQSEPEIVEARPQMTAIIRGTVAMDELPNFFDQSFQRLGAVLAAQGIEASGPAFGLYHREPGATADLEVGFPTAKAVERDGEVKAGARPGGRVARFVHAGSFDGLGASWERLKEWIEQQSLAPGDTFWEVYVTEPSPDMDPADLRTELNWPIT